MDRKRQRIFLFVICILFIFISFASLFYLVKEEGHSCTGEDCPICACIHQAEQILKNLEPCMVYTMVAKAVTVLSILMLINQFLLVFCTSLVSQKVRLND